LKIEYKINPIKIEGRGIVMEEERGRIAVIIPITRYPGFNTMEEAEQFIKDEGLKNSVVRELQKPIKPTEAEMDAGVNEEIERFEKAPGDDDPIILD
jgi:hypothetical protein